MSFYLISCIFIGPASFFVRFYKHNIFSLSSLWHIARISFAGSVLDVHKFIFSVHPYPHTHTHSRISLHSFGRSFIHSLNARFICILIALYASFYLCVCVYIYRFIASVIPYQKPCYCIHVLSIDSKAICRGRLFVRLMLMLLLLLLLLSLLLCVALFFFVHSHLIRSLVVRPPTSIIRLSHFSCCSFAWVLCAMLECRYH